MKKEILNIEKSDTKHWRSDTWKTMNNELTKTLHPLINDKTENNMAKRQDKWQGKKDWKLRGSKLKE
jgi:hypothetical protein